MQVAQDTMGYGAGREKTEPVRLWDRIMKVKDDDIPVPFALIVDAMRPRPSGQNLDEAIAAAQRGEAVRPESWTEYEAGLPDWGNDAQQYVNRNVEAFKERDGVWQEPDAYDNFIKAQNAAAFDLTMRQLWLMDFYDSRRDVYGDETVDSILSALKSDGKRLNAVAEMLKEEETFRGKFLDQEEFDTYQRLSKADAEDLKQWNEELGEKLNSLDGQLRGHTKFDLLYDTSLTPDDIQAYNDAQELWDARDRTQQTRNQVLRRYYQLDNESKLAQLELDPEAKALYETAGLDTTDRKTRKEAVRALEEMGFDYKRLSRYQQTQEDKERYETQREELKKEAREHPVIGSFVRTLVKPFETLNYLDMAVRSLTQGSPDDIENYEPLNVYNMGATNYVSGVQGEVSEMLAEDFPNFNVLDMNVPAFLYNTGMSMIDSFAGAKLLGRGVLPLMGGSAAANEMQDIIARGGNNQQALLGGTAAGAAEMLFEKVSIERILAPKTVTGMISMLENAGIQGFVELTEEGLTEAANILLDASIMCRDSRSARKAREYMLDGKSEEEAWQQVFLDNVIQVAWASAGGGLAGGIMGGFTGALDWAQNSRQGGRLNGLGEDVASAVIREGLDSPEGSQSYELASKLQDKLSRGKTPSNAEVGALYRANVAQINSENGAGPAEDTDGAAELERGTGRPGIRPTWDTDALLWQTAMEMNREADPLARTAMEMTQTGDAAPVDTGIEADYNGDEGGDSYGQTDGLEETAGYNRREGIGDGLYTDAGRTGTDAEGLGRIPAWAEGAQVQEPGEPAKQAVKTVRGYGVRAAEKAGVREQQAFPTPLVQLAQEMAGSSIALERTAMERVQLVQAQVAETFGPRARAFGWNGQVALLEEWNRQRGTQQHKRNFYDGFAVYYQAGLTGESMDQVSIRYTWMLTEPQKQTAYRAGRQDAAEFAARGRRTVNRGQVLGRGLEAVGEGSRTGKLSDGLMPAPMLTVAGRLRTALTGQLDRATISTAEAEGTVFSNEIDELQGRQIQYGDRQEFERDTGRIAARRVKNFSENNLFVQDGVKLSKRELRRINSLISRAKGLMEIAESCNIPIVISQNQTSIAAYNPRTDVIFVDSRFGKARIPWELQARYACPDHPLSTLVHEMYHWKDAYEYRKKVGAIKDPETLKAYTVYQRETAFNELKKAGFDLVDIHKTKVAISEYAFEEQRKNNFEEVYTEFRTKQMLGGK